MRKQSLPAIRLRIDLSPDGALGPGKIALLEHIAAAGSLSQAARELGMSYRRAWALLTDVNRLFAEPAVTANVGGAGGGGAQLTPFGTALVEAYREIERTATEAARTRLAWLASRHKAQDAKVSSVAGTRRISRRRSDRR